MVDSETLSMRRVAFTVAQELVQPICEAHPPEAYRITTTPEPLFGTPAGSTMTTSEQVVNMTISVADWLLFVE